MARAISSARPVVMPLLMSQNAEQVQRTGMLRVALDHAAVQ